MKVVRKLGNSSAILIKIYKTPEEEEEDYTREEAEIPRKREGGIHRRNQQDPHQKAPPLQDPPD